MRWFLKRYYNQYFFPCENYDKYPSIWFHKTQIYYYLFVISLFISMGSDKLSLLIVRMLSVSGTIVFCYQSFDNMLFPSKFIKFFQYLNLRTLLKNGLTPDWIVVLSVVLHDYISDSLFFNLYIKRKLRQFVIMSKCLITRIVAEQSHY